MEITSRLQERENTSPTTTSPTSNTTNTNNNGLLLFHTTQTTQTTSTTTPPLTPKQPISRSDQQPINNNNPYPTTFVQADPNTFKQVVQMLTGSPDTANVATKHPDPPITQSRNHMPPIKKQGFKLYERRNSHSNLRNGLVINPLLGSGSGRSPTGFSPRGKEILSPSVLNFPGLVLSPVTPLVEYPSSDSSSSPSVEEDKAIAEKGFYLHPSPRAGSEPRLLPLFPVTSPRVSNRAEP